MFIAKSSPVTAEAGLRGLLGALTSTPYSPTQHLEREQALAKQFAEILHFTLRFDELKVRACNQKGWKKKPSLFSEAIRVVFCSGIECAVDTQISNMLGLLSWPRVRLNWKADEISY